MSKFLDAQQRNKEHPDTFGVPSDRELNSLELGNNVKICDNKERFWVELSEIDGKKLSGRVNNDLVLPHSFICDDTISFERKNVMGIC